MKYSKKKYAKIALKECKLMCNRQMPRAVFSTVKITHCSIALNLNSMKYETVFF